VTEGASSANFDISRPDILALGLKWILKRFRRTRLVDGMTM
jgi:hypothetical protein